MYLSEQKLLHSTLNIKDLEFFHCGSTSIPGITAKPIIDIVGSVNNLTELDCKKDLLEKIGYEYKGEYGIPGRRYSVLYNPNKTKGYCHLHIFKTDNPKVKDHILFRNYLRENKLALNKYKNLKESLKLPRNQYTAAKSKLILELLSQAKQYFYK